MPQKPMLERSKTGEESLKTEHKPLNNFKVLAKHLVAVSREELKIEEDKHKRIRESKD